MSINKFTVSTAATLLYILETDYIMQILDSLSSTIPHTSVPQDDTSFKGEIKVLETDYIVKYNTTYNRFSCKQKHDDPNFIMQILEVQLLGDIRATDS